MQSIMTTHLPERSGIEDQVVLLCNEFPVSGIGKNSEEAFVDLLHAFRAYTEGAGDVDILTTEGSMIQASMWLRLFPTSDIP